MEERDRFCPRHHTRLFVFRIFSYAIMNCESGLMFFGLIMETYFRSKEVSLQIIYLARKCVDIIKFDSVFYLGCLFTEISQIFLERVSLFGD
jgi:hypothetical protein